MDVEGAEPCVLRGGEQSLRRDVVRHLMTEMNGPRLVEGGSFPERMVQLLSDLGFVPTQIRSKQVVQLPTTELDLPDHEYDRLLSHRSAL